MESTSAKLTVRGAFLCHYLIRLGIICLATYVVSIAIFLSDFGSILLQFPDGNTFTAAMHL